MDNGLLSRMIKDLILAGDEVGLPGLGTFTAELAPASFSDKGFTINPPYRRLCFRQGDTDDKKLSRLYAESNGIELKAAEVIIAKTVAVLSDTIKSSKVAVLPGLGRLRATRENDIFFVPEENLDIYPEGEGLGSISLKSHVETHEEIASAVGSLAAEMPSRPAAPAAGRPGRSLRRLLWLIPLILILTAALALAAFLVLCHTSPDFIDSILYTPEELRIINY